jgi:hypothetical protein
MKSSSASAAGLQESHTAAMKSFRIALITLLIAIAITVVAGFSSGWLDPQLKLKDNATTHALQLLAGLMFATLVVERVIEVLVGKPREPETERLETVQAAAVATVEDTKAARMVYMAAGAGAGFAEPPEVKPLETVAIAATQAVKDAKAETMNWSLLLGFALGAMLSACGIRTLAELWTPVSADFHWSFISLDLFLTAGLISGGSQGLHLLLDTFGTYLEKAKKK